MASLNYGKKSPSMGTPSVYSHVTSRSSANLRSSRSVKSVRIPWYQRRLLTHAIIMDIQKGAMFTAIYSLVLSLFTISTAIFDIYCYSQTTPGAIHYGYYIISYEFVYIGNMHVRNALIMFAMFSMLIAMAVFVTSIYLISGLRKEHENKMIPWLWVFGIFTIVRVVAFLFFSIVNDMIFSYNIIICLLWIIFTLMNLYGFLIVWSLFLELSDLTKLEDLAHLRIGTMQSLNASTTHSIAGSRPTTPHSTVSTMPVN
ncbi:uncharacterized protein LOC106655332 [Trichogramma pretiosum]|uniref:DUF7027 domain-containing protein n=1 Tax=Trichogramma kaykai TaxID=54128 RepID=A0ABD2XDL7_9HYME|nr:uncharacterized protein LOC106655332 [Trichogramma pretiosum]XP_014231148.1 uncharacterized protein LOC106655332 [Trichogramma pretiosum]